MGLCAAKVPAIEHPSDRKFSDARDDCSTSSGQSMIYTAYANSREQWMMSEERKMNRAAPAHVQKLEEEFQKLLQAHPDRERVNREDLRQTFAGMGIDIDDSFFSQIYTLFDINGDGEVNHREFIVALAWLLNVGGRFRDSDDLAFRLFDQDADDKLAPSEFNAMITSLLCSSLAHLLAFDDGYAAFREHLESEYATEMLDFWKAVQELHIKASARASVHSDDALPRRSTGLDKAVLRARELPVESVEEVHRRYIVPGAERQVNLSHDHVRAVTQQLEEARAKGDVGVQSAALDDAAREVLQVMSRDSFQRFRSGKIHYDFATKAWQSLSKELSEPITLDEFKMWAARNQDVFLFLNQLQKKLGKWAEREKLRKSQDSELVVRVPEELARIPKGASEPLEEEPVRV